MHAEQLPATSVNHTAHEPPRPTRIENGILKSCCKKVSALKSVVFRSHDCHVTIPGCLACLKASIFLVKVRYARNPIDPLFDVK